MTKTEKRVIFILVLILIPCITILVYKWWRSQVEVYSYKQRAQVAAQDQDMLGYLQSLSNGMEKWKMTSGHYALIFKTPWNDAGLDYRAVCKAIERVNKIAKMSPTSVAYQTGMDDVRGIVREIDMNVFYFWALHTPLLWGFWIYIFAAWISWMGAIGYVLGRAVHTSIKDRRYLEQIRKNKKGF